MVEYSRYLRGIETTGTWTGYVWMDIDVEIAPKTNGWDMAMAMDIAGKIAHKINS